jgi:tetratricopeptide (TPR) repeat protein
VGRRLLLRWWPLVLAAALVWPVAAAVPRAGWDAYTRAGLAALEAGRYVEAETMLKAALGLVEVSPRADRRLAESLGNLANLFITLHRYEKAEPLVLRALAVEERRAGARHPAVAAVLTDYLDLLRRLGRHGELPAVEARLRAILADPTVRAPSLVWEKRGAGPGDLDRDEDECGVTARYGGTPYGPLIDPDEFTRCVESRGWRKTVVAPAKEGSP